MADMKKSLATLFDDLTALNPPRRREVPEEVRTVADTFAEVLRVGMTDDEILAYYRHRYPYISRSSAVFGQSCSGPRTHDRPDRGRDLRPGPEMRCRARKRTSAKSTEPSRRSDIRPTPGSSC